MEEIVSLYEKKYGKSYARDILNKRANVLLDETSVKIPIPYATEFFLRNNTSDWLVFEQVFLHDEYDHPILKGINPKIVIDAGANIGCSTVFFCNKFLNAKIYAVEPENSNFELLVKNTLNYKNVTCINAGLWNEMVPLKIKDTNVEKWAFATDLAFQQFESNSVVKTITIQKIIEEYNIEYIDILKIDIECAEKYLFYSKYESWINKVNIIIIELHDWIEPGCSKAFYSAISKYNFIQFHKGENIYIVLDCKEFESALERNSNKN